MKNSELTIKQLKEACDAKGIKYTAKEKKASLVSKLDGKPAVQAKVGRAQGGEY